MIFKITNTILDTVNNTQEVSFKELKLLVRKSNLPGSYTQKLDYISKKLSYANFNHLRAVYIRESFKELSLESGIENPYFINNNYINILEDKFKKSLNTNVCGDVVFIHDKLEEIIEDYDSPDIIKLKYVSSFGDAEISLTKNDMTFIKINFFNALTIKMSSSTYNYENNLNYLLQLFSLFFQSVKFNSFKEFTDNMSNQLGKTV